MARALLDALSRDRDLLTRESEAVSRVAHNFRQLCNLYSSSQVDSRVDSVVHSIMRRLFRLFLAAMDDAMVLFTGKLCRSYHKSAHAKLYGSSSALHSRGKEGSYFKHTEEFSRCSIDGFNYEYRRARCAKGISKHEDSLDCLVSSIETISSSLQESITIIQNSFMLTVNFLLGPKVLGSSFQLSVEELRHMGESFTFSISTARSEGVAAVVAKKNAREGSAGIDVPVLKSWFRYSREEEATTEQYNTHIDLSKDFVVESEKQWISKYLTVHGNSLKPGPELLLRKYRVILDDEDDSDSYRPKVKQKQPLPLELVIIRESSSTNPNVAPDRTAVDFRNRKRSLNESEVQLSDHDSVSINAIKRQLCQDLDSFSGVDAVERESMLLDPMAAHISETKSSVSFTKSCPDAGDVLARRCRTGTISSDSGGASDVAVSARNDSSLLEPRISMESTVMRRTRGPSNDRVGNRVGLFTVRPSCVVLICRIQTSGQRSTHGSDANQPGTDHVYTTKEFPLSVKWYSGSSSRLPATFSNGSLTHRYASSPAIWISSLSKHFVIPVSTVLDICCSVMWRDLMCGGDGVLQIPTGLVVNQSTHLILRAGDFIDFPVNDPSTLHVMCDVSPEEGDVFALYARGIRSIQELNQGRLSRRMLIPPVDLIRAMNSALRSLVPGIGTDTMRCLDDSSKAFEQKLHLDLQNCVSLSAGPRQVLLLYRESAMDTCSTQSLQNIYVMLAILSLRNISKNICLNMSRLVLSGDILAFVMTHCVQASCQACGLTWTSIAFCLISEAPRDANRTEDLSSGGYIEFDGAPSVGSLCPRHGDKSILSLDISANSGFLCRMKGLMLSNIYNKFIDRGIIKSERLMKNIDGECEYAEEIEDILIQICLDYLVLVPSLRHLDLSYCFDSKESCIMLCKKLYKSLCNRSEAKLVPLESLFLVGLESCGLDSTVKDSWNSLFLQSASVLSVFVA